MLDTCTCINRYKYTIYAEFICRTFSKGVGDPQSHVLFTHIENYYYIHTLNVIEFNVKTCIIVLWVSDDAFIYHNNMKFSTKDRDNDLSSSINCASYYGEPWWNNDCSRMMFTRNNFNDLGWYNWYTGSYKQLSKIRMMIRKPLIVETSGKFLRSHVLFKKTRYVTLSFLDVPFKKTRKIALT